MYASFLSALIFSVPKGENGSSGAGFLSVLIKSVDTWDDSSS